jgi:hypothetical protein
MCLSYFCLNKSQLQTLKDILETEVPSTFEYKLVDLLKSYVLGIYVR